MLGIGFFRIGRMKKTIWIQNNSKKKNNPPRGGKCVLPPPSLKLGGGKKVKAKKNTHHKDQRGDSKLALPNYLYAKLIRYFFGFS